MDTARRNVALPVSFSAFYFCKRTVKLKFVLSLLLTSIFASASYAYEGIEECVNSEVGVHSVAQQMMGPSWKYTYKGQVYKIDYSDWAACTKCRVEHKSEKLLSYKCKDGEIVNRKSIRRVVLREPNGQVAVDTELTCEGSFANGLVPPTPFPSCM